MEELEKGYVLRGNDDKPYMMRMNGAQPWIYFWNNPGWVSLRASNQTEIWNTYPHKVSDEEAKTFCDQHNELVS